MGRKAKVKAVGLTQENDATSKLRTASIASNPNQELRYDKDAEEVNLEKLVFGDDEGFQAALGSEAGQEEFPRELGEESLGVDSEDGAEVQSEIEEVADEDVSACMSSKRWELIAKLFFIDTGLPSVNQQPLTIPKVRADLTETQDEDAPAWIDSEDERIVVSLASDTRLRKLRKREGEDLIDGIEYMKRLQDQFERLYPRPEWARTLGHTHRKKRRRTSESESSGDPEDSDAMSINLDNLSLQPLSKLLQSTNSLTQGPNKASNQ